MSRIGRWVARPPRRPLGNDLLCAGDQLTQHGLCFHPGQRSSQTHVWAIAERDVLSRIAIGVVVVGCGRLR